MKKLGYRQAIIDKIKRMIRSETYDVYLSYHSDLDYAYRVDGDWLIGLLDSLDNSDYVNYDKNNKQNYLLVEIY